MANYLYNGVELPALPEWDKEIYPYAIISRNFLGADFILYVAETVTYYYDDDGQYCFTFQNGGKVFYYSCNEGDSNWGNYADVTGSTLGNMGIVDSVWMVWVNFNVLRADGSVAFAASDPVPVYNATEFFNGVALGLSGTGVPAFEENSCFGKGYLAGAELRLNRPKPKIVAYSYNGVQLPPLPEWDRETYPYAFIEHTKNSSVIYVANAPLGSYYMSSLNTTMMSTETNVTYGWKWGYLRKNGEVVDPSFTSESAAVSLSLVSPDDVLWANYDVPDYVNGGTLLAASEPVPVYG